jgi:hypothetical protein
MPRSPRRRIRLASVTSRIGSDRRPGRATIASAKLDTSNGYQDHTVLPYAATLLVLRGLIAHGQGRPAIALARNAVRVHRSPHSTYRDDAYAPLHEAGWREQDSNFEKWKAEYFQQPNWTTQITLNGLMKFVSARNPFCSLVEARLRGRRRETLADLPVGLGTNSPELTGCASDRASNNVGRRSEITFVHRR